MYLDINHYTVQTPLQTLFEIEHVVINPGDKIAFVAKNGTGKTTLFKMIQYASQNSVPQITLTATLGYLPQQKERQNRSGGEETKDLLLNLLNQQPALLLLDEPSNHLDRKNRQWLADVLKRKDQTLLFSSHDRKLLKEVATKIWYLEDKKLHVFNGTYEEFVVFDEKKQEKAQEEYQQALKKRQALEREILQKKQRAENFTQKDHKTSSSEWKARSYMGHFDGQAKKIAKTAKSLETRLKQTEPIEKPITENKIVIKPLGKMIATKGTLFHLKDFTLKRGEKKLFQLDDWRVKTGDHFLITGDNGSGKTTFLEEIYRQSQTQTLPPHDSLEIGFFRQHPIFEEENITLLNYLKKHSLQENQVIYYILATLGFKKDALNKKIHQLSGGEKVRFSLASILLGNYHLLFLDEPSNSLDLDTLLSLEKFLKDYPGNFLLVTHDEELGKKVTSATYTISHQTFAKEKATKKVSQENLKDEYQILTYKKDQLMQDPTFPLEEIRKINQQLLALERKMK